MTHNPHESPHTKPWQSVLVLHWKRWKSGSLYWLRSLGVDLDDRDPFSRLYVLYVLAIAVIWVALSFSLVLNLAANLGRQISPGAYPALGVASVIFGIIVITRSSSAAPLYLTHGDIEWVTSSPLSPRVLAPFHFPRRQLKTFLIATLLASLAAAAVHYRHITELAVTSALWMSSCQAAGWNLSAIHYSRSRRPLRFFWAAIMLSLIILAAVFQPFVAKISRELTPGYLHPVTFATLLGALWILAFFTSARINLMNIHEASALFADIEALGTAYLPNHDMVQQIRNQRRITRSRILGRLPLWFSPWSDTGRVVITAIRSPRYAWNLLELTLLFRFGLLLLSPGADRWAWLFWLFIAYRFRQGHMAFVLAQDVSNPFLNQFWPANMVKRFVQSTWLPFALVFVTSFVLWLSLPLTVSVTLPHIVFFISLILSWVLGEGLIIIRNSRDTQFLNHYHLAAVAASGLVMMIAVAMHHPLWSLLVPLGLMLAMVPSLGQNILHPLSAEGHESDNPKSL